jgi:hypothetical protein
MTHPHPLLGAGYEVHPDTGEFVNSDFMRIAEIINDYSSMPGSPELYLSWIRPTDRETAEDLSHPYAVIQILPNGQHVAIFTLREDELDHRVIARIMAGDQSKSDVFAQLAKDKDAQELLKLKRKQAEIEQAIEFQRDVLKSPLHTFKHNGKVYQ